MSPEDRIAHYPDFAYWYNMSIDDLLNLPPVIAEVYANALPRIKAEFQIMAIQANNFGNMEKKDQKALIASLKRDLGTDEVRKPQSKEEAEFLLKSVGIGLVTPDKDEDHEQESEGSSQS